MKNKLILAVTILLGLTCYAQKQTSVRVSVDIGYGYRFAELSDNIPSQLRDYTNELRSGLNIDTHLGFLIKPNWGLGIVYNRLSANNSINLFSPVAINGIEIFETSDKISTNFIAPEFFYNILSVNEKHSYISTLSIGYIAYKNKATLNTVPLENTGGSVGLGFGFMYDYHITSTISIGAGVNYVVGELSRINVTVGGETQQIELPNDERQNLSYLAINAGFRFNL